MKISTRIKQIMKEKGMTQTELSKRSGISKSTLSEWLNDKYEPKQNSIYILSQALDVNPTWLMGLDVNKEIKIDISTIYNELNKPRQQKVYSFAEHQLEEQRYLEEHHDEYHGQTAAGAPIEGQQPIPFIGATTVNLLVNGDSMEPNFHDGDIIKYHPQPELENGEIGVFAVNGGITMKKFRRNSDIRLESLNKKYEDIIIKETDDFSILGKVISREGEM